MLNVDARGEEGIPALAVRWILIPPCGGWRDFPFGACAMPPPPHLIQPTNLTSGTGERSSSEGSQCYVAAELIAIDRPSEFERHLHWLGD